MADSKIKTPSPMTFNHFRYDVRKKRKKKKKKKKCNRASRSISIGTSDKMLRYIILLYIWLFCGYCTQCPRKLLNIFRKIFPNFTNEKSCQASSL